MIRSFAVCSLLNQILWVTKRNCNFYFFLSKLYRQKINTLSFIRLPEWCSAQSPGSDPGSYTVSSLFFCYWNAEIWIYFRHICQLVITHPYRQDTLGPEYANLAYWNYTLGHPLPGWFKAGFICFCLRTFTWQLLFPTHNLLDSDNVSCIQSSITTKVKATPGLKVLTTFSVNHRITVTEPSLDFDHNHNLTGPWHTVFFTAITRGVQVKYLRMVFTASGVLTRKNPKWLLMVTFWVKTGPYSWGLHTKLRSSSSLPAVRIQNL